MKRYQPLHLKRPPRKLTGKDALVWQTIKTT